MKAQTIIVEKRSLMKASEVAKRLVEQLTIDEKISLLSTTQSAVPRLGISAYQVGGEAAHGVVDREGGKTTAFPLPIGLAQTWNPRLLKEVGKVIGTEARIKYLDSGKRSWLTLWAPTIDMLRDPRWGRNEEAYGEDPYLTNRLSKEVILGMQGDNPEHLQMAAAPKHFFGNNNEIGRESTSNFIPLRAQEEYYVKAFETAFTEANAQSMMTAYNGVNGIPCMQAPEVQEIVKDRWKMDGFVVSDGGALTLNVDTYHYYETYAQAIADAIKHGVDCLVDDKELVETAAKEALSKGLLTEKEINTAVENCLRVRARLGHFTEDNPYDQVDRNLLAGTKHAAIAKKATLEQVVLLKNVGNLLPLKQTASISVVGPLADVAVRDWYAGHGPYQKTIATSLKNVLSEDKWKGSCDSHDRVSIKMNQQFVNVTDNFLTLGEKQEFRVEEWADDQLVLVDEKSGRYLTEDGTGRYQLHQTEIYDWFVKEAWKINSEKEQVQENSYIGQAKTWAEEEIGVKDGFIQANQQSANITFIQEHSGIEEAVTLAKTSNVAVVVLGNHPMINGRETQDRPSISLPHRQLELLKQVYEVNPHVVLIIVGSYPFDLSWANEHIPAILFTAHGSQELGEAMAEILYGTEQPSGKLAQTWFSDISFLPAITNYDYIQFPRTYHYYRQPVLYPFGYGLTYGNMTATVQECRWRQEEVTMVVTLKNQSDKPSVDTLQLYGQVTEFDLPMPKKLVWFDKVHLCPQEEKRVSIRIPLEAFSYFDVRTERFQLPSGNLELFCGFSSEAELCGQFVLPTQSERVRIVSDNLNIFSFDAYNQAQIIVNEEKQRVIQLESNGWLSYQNTLFEESSYMITVVADRVGTIQINEKSYEVVPGEQRICFETPPKLTKVFIESSSPVLIEGVVKCTSKTSV
ncbi:hypothetical protein RV11_GL002760 [Enterococcus phoeniculicola]|nr:hypothetical protein RV11_GL002760 [Enterococcus phoeniculicola]